MTEVDWRKMLKVYMAEVLRCEGVTFWYESDELTPQENKMMKEVEAEIIND